MMDLFHICRNLSDDQRFCSQFRVHFVHSTGRVLPNFDIIMTNYVGERQFAQTPLVRRFEAGYYAHESNLT